MNSNTGNLGINSQLTDIQCRSITTKGMLNVLSFKGVSNNGVNDTTVALQAAIDYAYNNGIGKVFLPFGVYKVSSTIYLRGNTIYTGDGRDTVIKLDRTNLQNPFVLPVVITENIYDSIIIRDLTIDQQAQLHTFPQINSVGVPYTSALLVKSDNTRVENCYFFNSFDNGIGFWDFSITGQGTVADPFVVAQIISSPQNCTAISCYGNALGVGDKIGGIAEGKVGGFNILSGKNCSFIDCVVENSYNGFILDLAAGGSGSFTNCRAENILEDPANIGNGAGRGFFIGAGPCQLNNCVAFFCDTTGYYTDVNADNPKFVNCVARDCKHEGFLVDSTYSTFVNCEAKANSRTNPNVYSGMKFFSTNNMRYAITNCVFDRFGTQLYAIEEEILAPVPPAVFSNEIFGQISGCVFLDNGSPDPTPLSLADTTTLVQNVNNGAFNVLGKIISRTYNVPVAEFGNVFPANPIVGDFYVDDLTGEVWIYTALGATSGWSQLTITP